MCNRPLQRAKSVVGGFVIQLAQIIGEMRIEGHSLIPFRIYRVERLEGWSNNMEGEEIDIHSCNKGAQSVWRGGLPLCFLFAFHLSVRMGTHLCRDSVCIAPRETCLLRYIILCTGGVGSIHPLVNDMEEVGIVKRQ